jgi:sterol desaturase/sphingolipid hydroxylase (fatty acid hydroxylase superfamily)
MENAMFALVLVAVALAERVPQLRFEPLPFVRRGFATDLFCLATGAFALANALRAGAVGFAGANLATPTIPVVLLAIVLYDLGGYLSHRMLHRFDVLWRFHKVHHSSPALDWLASFRAHLVEHALRHAVSLVGLVALGFPLVAVGIASATYGAAAALAHSNLRLPLGALEPVLVTPRLHRVHHVARTCHANFGTIFSVWDRFAGALIAGADAPPGPLGVPGEITTYPQSWPRQLVEPFRAAQSSSAAPSSTPRRNIAV